MFTTLTKEGMPLLRYRTRDLSTLTSGPCECGRTSVRMGKILGRSDDMLIIRGINVFPSQVESVLLEIRECAPHYKLIIDRKDNLDTLLVQVEMRQEYFEQGFDTLTAITDLERKVASAIKSVLSISAKVQIVPPNSLERSEGKSRFVEDRRKIE